MRTRRIVELPNGRSSIVWFGSLGLIEKATVKLKEKTAATILIDVDDNELQDVDNNVLIEA